MVGLNDPSKLVDIPFASGTVPRDVGMYRCRDGIIVVAGGETESGINHYFRYLYLIIKYIHCDSNISSKDKKLYVGLVQAQMNNKDYLKWLDHYSFFETMHRIKRSVRDR